MSYTVKTATFSGPFDLLLRLVSKQMVDISTLSIAEIADQYVAEVTSLTKDKNEPLDLEVASDFLLVASTLLEIKSRSLLGRKDEKDSFEEEEASLSPEDAREILIARLIAYKQVRDVAKALSVRLEKESKMVARYVGPEPEFLHVVPDYVQISIEELAKIGAEVEERQQQVIAEANHIAPKRISVARAIKKVDAKIAQTPKTTFTQMLEGEDKPEEVVVLLLALLELYKFGSIKLRQKHVFEEIEIERIEGATEYAGALTDYDSVGPQDEADEAAAAEKTAEAEAADVEGADAPKQPLADDAPEQSAAAEAAAEAPAPTPTPTPNQNPKKEEH